ncbi:MAG TPA: ABC transporter permease, partial [Chitinophagales bacterium]|nr:ABC transporter permease [Chitinophagales bacterium]
PSDYILLTAEPTPLTEYLRKLWKFRNMIGVFALQEIKVSYAQTKLGALWLVMKPLLVLALFTFVFGRIIKIYPYALFAFTGLFPWNYFSFLVGNGSNALISNQQLIRKIYFPRMVLPLAKVLVGLLEVGVSLIIMFALMAIYDFPFTLKLLWLPGFLLLNIITGLGIALWLNALNLRYRDLNQFIPYFINFIIWLTPVFYPSTLVPDEYGFLLYANPMAGIIELYRWAIMDDVFPSAWYLIAFAEVVLIFISGVLLFIRIEDDIADYL